MWSGPVCFQGQLREAIRDMVLRCSQTLFIFDEAEKLHPGLINAIKPYMDHYDNVDGVSYRGAIFLFLRWVFTPGTFCLLLWETHHPVAPPAQVFCPLICDEASLFFGGGGYVSEELL